MSPSSDTGPDLVIGILGGIASGKSRVAGLLAGAGGEVVDADLLAREVLVSDEVAERVRVEFGEEFLDPRGRPDSVKLAREVFGDPEKRRRLESWIHPRVREKIHASVAGARTAGRRPIVLDVPLLLENEEQRDLARLCDTLVFVASGPMLREERARQTRDWSPGELARRELAQVPLEEKRQRAEHVIENQGSPKELEESVQRLRATLGFS